METPILRNMSILTAKSSFNDTINRGPIDAVCPIGECSNDSEMRDSLHNLRVNILNYETDADLISQDNVAFVLDQFEGPVFERLCKERRTVYGPTAIKESSAFNRNLVRRRRPLFCRSMEGIVVVFSGFGKEKAILEELVNLVHYMGGSVRQQYGSKVTHVVSATTQSEKYRLAVAAGCPVMSEDWVRRAWERRDVAKMYAFSDEMKQYKLPAFYGLRLAFNGFSLEDTLKMETRTGELGGVVVEPVNCTHYVIDSILYADGSSIRKPNVACRLVSGEWFWTSAQLDICANETVYPPQEKVKNGILSPTAPEMFKSHDITHSRPSVRRRSISSTAMNATANFDVSNDASCMLDEHMFSVDDLETFMKSPTKTGVSKRQLACAEMLQTEANYVKALEMCITVFKEPLEKADAYGHRLLSQPEVDTIFNNLPDIVEVHQKIELELAALIKNWNEKNCIGNVWLRYKEELAKCYAPYINYHPRARNMLIACTQKNRRFQDFLEACRKKPECERQVLQDILIRPVQRLGSVVLLLTEIKKRTEKSHDDYDLLQKAMDALNAVLIHCNEDKRKTEGYTLMFDVLKEIADCPAHLLSSQRQLIAQVDVSDLSGIFCKKKSSILTLYLFNDCLEIAKKKQQKKAAKHKDLIPLNRIRRIVNVTGSSDASNMFVLTIRDNLSDTDYTFSFLGCGDRRDSLGSTSSVDMKTRKNEFLHQLCNYVVMVTGRTGFIVEDHDSESKDESELSSAIRKAVKRVQLQDGSLKRTISVRTIGRSGGIRRSLSHAVMNFGGTLSRMSRSNLRIPLQGIVEEAAVNLSRVKNDSSLLSNQ